MCKVNYHHNFRVFNGQRIYYDIIPDIIQVGEHQFAEKRVINMWISMMLLSWTSATNCAQIYNVALSGRDKPDWQFSFNVTGDQVYDAFTIISLLEDCQLRQQTLAVPHGGPARDRFLEAMRVRNNRLRLCSQPELFHYCNKCTRFLDGMIHHLYGLLSRFDYFTDNRKVSVVVIDGVTIGHPCCGHPNCKIPLANNQDRFCGNHNGLKDVCAIVGCSNMVVAGRKVCTMPEHQDVEDVYNARGQARFQLKERLERAHVAHPNNSIAFEISNIDDLIDDNDSEDGFQKPSPNIPFPSMPNDPKSLHVGKEKKVRAKFGRRRTHNEQIFVAPCGIIIARETFFHAEALYSVVVSHELMYNTTYL